MTPNEEYILLIIPVFGYRVCLTRVNSRVQEDSQFESGSDPHGGFKKKKSSRCLNWDVQSPSGVASVKLVTQ